MLTKLEVLKQFLQYVIDNKQYYNWYDERTCNCGLLLKSANLSTDSVMSADNYRFKMKIKGEKQYNTSLYRNIFKMYSLGTCDTTNLPFTQVLNTLLGYGFTLQELMDLEHLADKRFNTEDLNYVNVDNLITYLNNWINYEEQLVNVVPSLRGKVKSTDTVTVAVTSL